MAILKKTLFSEDLEKYSVLVQDTDPKSKYFKITELPDVFTGGKNAFLIQGSEFLVSDTLVKIEIKDSQGNVIYHEPGEGIPEYYEGTSKVVAVYIYPDTAFGPCTITILGELSEYEDANGIRQPIPLQYKDTYNVRWQGVVNVNPFLANTTKIRFYRRPKIEITEQVLPVYNRIVTQKTLTGVVSGVPVQPASGSDYRTYKGILQYELQMGGSDVFSQSMENTTMSINVDGNIYNPTITDVFTDKRAFVNVPYFVTSSLLPTYQSVTGFTNKPFTITYEDSETLSNSNVSSSFAVIRISDLESFTGDPARIKVYASSKHDLGDYQLLEDIQLESSEIFLARSFNNQLNVRTGIFTQEILDEFWVTDAMDTNPIVSIDNSLLMKSVRLEPQTDFSSSNGLFCFHYKTPLEFNKNTEYQLDFTPLLATSSGYGGIEVYLSGSAFGKTHNDFGKEIFLLDVNQTYGTFPKQQINFKPDMDGTGQVKFVVNGGTWHLSNISLRAAEESSFSPNETTLIADVPTKINNETFDFKFEIYDINNNYVPVTIEQTYTFTGGNDIRIRRDLEVTPTVNQFNFSTSSAFPSSILIDYVKTGLTGAVTFHSQAIDTTGLGITESDLIMGSNYPGLLTEIDVDTVQLPIEAFTGSLSGGKKVGAITYTASCENINRYFTIYRVEQGAPSYLFYATADKNNFTFDPDDNYKSVIEDDFIDIRLVKQNLPSTQPVGLLINSSSEAGNPVPLTEIGTVGNATIYRLYVTSSTHTTDGYYFGLGQSTYDFDLDTVDGHFTSSITIDAIEKGDKAKGLFVTSDRNQFFYKMTNLSATPSNQTATILVKRQNLGSLTTPITITKSGGGPNLVEGSTTNGVTTYTIDTNSFTYNSGETKYIFKAYDLNGVEYSDELTISPVISESQISVNLSNENATLPALSNGFVASGSFVLTSGSVSVKVGTEDIAREENLGANNKFDIISLTGTNCIPNGGQGVNPGDANYSITSLSADSGSLAIVVRYKDGRGVLTDITKSVTYTKAKAARPNILVTATPQAQTVAANAAGTQTGTLANVVVSALEGTTDRFTSMDITSISGFSTQPTINGNTLVMTSAVMNADEASVTLGVKHTDSENTGNQGQSITIRASKIKQGESGVVVNVNPASQTVTLSNTGTYGTPSQFGVSVLEGATTYTYNASLSSNSTFRILSVLNGTNNNNGTITPNTPTTTSGTNVTFTVEYKNAAGSTATVSQSHRVSVTLDGQTGPGVVFTGVWQAGRAYQFSTGAGTGRRDVVLWSPSGTAPYENYYAAIRQHTSEAGNVPNGAPNQSAQTAWENLGSQDFFVAAKIGIFEESYVQNTLNIGTNNNGGVSTANITLAGGTANPFFSLGQTVQGVYGANGIYIGNDGGSYRASFVNGTDSFLKWNGSNLEIKGSITITGGNAATTGYVDQAESDAISTAAGDATTKANAAQAAAIAVAAASGSTDPTTQRITKSATPSGAGLYLGSNNLGYYDGGVWRTYMASTGNFFLGSTSDANYLEWNNATGILTIKGAINITGGNAATTGYVDQAETDAISTAAGDATTKANAAQSAAISTAAADATAKANAVDAKVFTSTAGLINKAAAPSGAGLYLGSSYLGYYNGSAWRTYMANNGDFFLTGGAGSQGLTWNAAASTLAIDGAIVARSGYIGNGVSGWKINSTSIESANGQTLLTATDGTIRLRDTNGVSKVVLDYGTSAVADPANASAGTFTINGLPNGTATFSAGNLTGQGPYGYLQYPGSGDWPYAPTWNRETVITPTLTGAYELTFNIPVSSNLRTIWNGGTYQNGYVEIRLYVYDQLGNSMFFDSTGKNYVSFPTETVQATWNYGRQYNSSNNLISLYMNGLNLVAGTNYVVTIQYIVFNLKADNNVTIYYGFPTTTINYVAAVASTVINQSGFNVSQDTDRYMFLKPGLLDFYDGITDPSKAALKRKIVGELSGAFLLLNSDNQEWHNFWQRVYISQGLFPRANRSAGGNFVTSYFYGGYNRAFQILRAYAVFQPNGTTGFGDYGGGWWAFAYNIQNITYIATNTWLVTFVEPIYGTESQPNGTGPSIYAVSVAPVDGGDRTIVNVTNQNAYGFRIELDGTSTDKVAILVNR